MSFPSSLLRDSNGNGLGFAVNGARFLRIVTAQSPVTRAREKAEEAINTPVVSAYASQRAATLAQEGDYHTSMGTSAAWGSLLLRSAKQEHQQAVVQGWAGQMRSMNAALQRAVATEADEGLDWVTASENVSAAGKGKKKSAKMKVARSRMRKERRTKDDDMSNVIRRNRFTSPQTYSAMYTPSVTDAPNSDSEM